MASDEMIREREQRARKIQRRRLDALARVRHSGSDDSTRGKLEAIVQALSASSTMVPSTADLETVDQFAHWCHRAIATTKKLAMRNTHSPESYYMQQPNPLRRFKQSTKLSHKEIQAVCNTAHALQTLMDEMQETQD